MNFKSEWMNGRKEIIKVKNSHSKRSKSCVKKVWILLFSMSFVIAFVCLDMVLLKRWTSLSLLNSYLTSFWFQFDWPIKRICCRRRLSHTVQMMMMVDVLMFCFYVYMHMRDHSIQRHDQQVGISESMHTYTHTNTHHWSVSFYVWRVCVWAYSLYSIEWCK